MVEARALSLEAFELDDMVVFDIEATSADAKEAEIVQIAAIHPLKPDAFVEFVKTEAELTAEDKVWEITKIDFQEYQTKIAEKDSSLGTVLKKFLDYVGDRPLAGHNIERYDIPLLEQQLKRCDLALPKNLLTLDSLNWSLVRYPTPPDGLRGYKLGDLYEFFTGEVIEGAHQADKDCEANLVVLKKLQETPPQQKTLKLWHHLGIKYASLYKHEIPPIPKDEARELLNTQADVPHVNKAGDPFPAVSELVPDYFEGLTAADLGSVAESRHTLIDEYQLLVDPVVLAGGASLFEGLEHDLKLKLLESRAFKNGAMFLRYRAEKRK